MRPRQYASSYRVIQTKGVANGQQPFADIQLVGIAEHQKRQIFFAIHLQQGQICFFIRPNKAGRKRFTFTVLLVQRDSNDVRIGHHMVVGDYIAVSGHQKP